VIKKSLKKSIILGKVITKIVPNEKSPQKWRLKTINNKAIRIADFLLIVSFSQQNANQNIKPQT